MSVQQSEFGTGLHGVGCFTACNHRTRHLFGGVFALFQTAISPIVSCGVASTGIISRCPVAQCFVRRGRSSKGSCANHAVHEPCKRALGDSVALPKQQTAANKAQQSRSVGAQNKHSRSRGLDAQTEQVVLGCLPSTVNFLLAFNLGLPVAQREGQRSLSGVITTEALYCAAFSTRPRKNVEGSQRRYMAARHSVLSTFLRTMVACILEEPNNRPCQDDTTAVVVVGGQSSVPDVHVANTGIGLAVPAQLPRMAEIRGA